MVTVGILGAVVTEGSRLLEEKDEIDQEEAERDKLVEQVIVYLVPPSDCRQPLQSASEVETEIRARVFRIDNLEGR